MVSPRDVAGFHAAYDHHRDDRIRLFGAVRDAVPGHSRVLYAGSYVDIAPSVWFDDVSYVDVDRRAGQWFGHVSEVDALIASKREQSLPPGSSDRATWAFHHRDYREPLPIEEGSIDLLVSLYAGFISEHCTRYLRPGGFLLANDSHGDVSMAVLDPRYRLHAVVTSHGDDYQVSTDDLDAYLQPQRGTVPTRAALHATNRGIAYTKQPFAYLLQRGA
ncbi:MAG: hypothetical protein WA966_04730 [Ornithinimicrobium sp.]